MSFTAELSAPLSREECLRIELPLNAARPPQQCDEPASNSAAASAGKALLIREGLGGEENPWFPRYGGPKREKKPLASGIERNRAQSPDYTLF